MKKGREKQKSHLFLGDHCNNQMKNDTVLDEGSSGDVILLEFEIFEFRKTLEFFILTLNIVPTVT
jgi:hypothetical protein